MCNERVFDNTIKLKENSILKIYPDLFNEWDFERNDELGIDIYKITYGSKKKVWWICPKCESSYEAIICNRTISQSKCPYCSGKKVNYTNSLISLRADIATEWHPTLNGKLTPNDITCGNDKKAWWLGTCGHEWDMVIKDRVKLNQGCPYCSNHRVLKGFNDMWTTNSIQASWLLNPENGYKFTQSSNSKVNWKCECGEIIKNKKINEVKRVGLSCSRCSDGISLGEKVVYVLLNTLSIEFIHNKTLNWSKGKRYDFYLPSQKIIIEVHGSQHYDSSFEHIGGKSLEEEQLNDEYKKELALKNNIKHYIEIDARKTDLKWIKRSILNSQLVEILGITECIFKNLNIKLNNSLMVKTWNLHKEKNMTVNDISRKLSIGNSAVNRYLKIGTSLGECDYDPTKSNDKTKRKVVKLTLDNVFLNEYESITSATLMNNIKSHNSISLACKDTLKTAYGFKWMYKEDYDKYIKDKELHSKVV